jgi:hypothetical protein
VRGVFGGRADLLIEHFPQSGGAGKGPGWSPKDAAGAMMRACADRGVWSPSGRVRGRGAWTDEDGGLVLHCGDAILFRDEWRRPGEIEGPVYPSDLTIPRPLEEDWREAPAFEQLRDLLASWRWLRDHLDVYLLAGWVCAAMFGGALDWRPLVWITGDVGTGKSTLYEAMRLVMGQGRAPCSRRRTPPHSEEPLDLGQGRPFLVAHAPRPLLLRRRERRRPSPHPAPPAGGLQPSRVRSEIRSRSNGAMEAKTWNVRRPAGVVVSMSSASERKPAPRSGRRP